MPPRYFMFLLSSPRYYICKLSRRKYGDDEISEASVVGSYGGNSMSEDISPNQKSNEKIQQKFARK